MQEVFFYLKSDVMVNCVHTTQHTGVFMKPNDFHSSRAGQAIRTQNGYWAFIPAPLPPDLERSPTLITALSDAERELARLTTLAGDFPFPRLLV